MAGAWRGRHAPVAWCAISQSTAERLLRASGARPPVRRHPVAGLDQLMAADTASHSRAHPRLKPAPGTALADMRRQNRYLLPARAWPRPRATAWSRRARSWSPSTDANLYTNSWRRVDSTLPANPEEALAPPSPQTRCCAQALGEPFCQANESLRRQPTAEGRQQTNGLKEAQEKEMARRSGQKQAPVTAEREIRE